MGKAISKSCRALAVLGVALLFSDMCLSGQSKTWVQSDGTKVVGDINTGLTLFDVAGHQSMIFQAHDLAVVCKALDDQRIPSSDVQDYALICEHWAELQPHTQIERVPFVTYVARLFLDTTLFTDFSRYRGVELQSTKEGNAYDAIMLPNDVGDKISCDIKAGVLPDKTWSIYECTIETSSFQEAIQLKERLVTLLAPLKLTEDEVQEHGAAAQAREDNRCAPTGECDGAHEYATTKRGGKMLVVEANPTFSRTADDVAMTLKSGRAFFSGISPNSGLVTIDVYSVKGSTATQ
jgi:hypothetical protein